MPLYAFECTACGHDFERLQKLSDADPTECPKCGAPQVKRQLTAPQFRLAGAGWYETDFKKDGDKKRNLAGDSSAPKESPGSASESKSDSKSSESKPAATAGSSGSGGSSSSAGSSASSSSSGGSGSSGSSGSGASSSGGSSGSSGPAKSS